MDGDSGDLSYPRGIWYERSRKRYRVRLYRNHTTHHAGYFDTEEEAQVALDQLKDKLAKIPKRKRNAKVVGRVPSASSVGDMLRASRERE